MTRSLSFSLTLSLAAHGAAIAAGYMWWRASLFSPPQFSVQGGTGAEEGSSGAASETISLEPQVADGLTRPADLPEQPPPASAQISSQIPNLAAPDFDESQSASSSAWQGAAALPAGPVMSGSGESSIGLSAGTTAGLASTWAGSRGKGEKPGEGSGDGIAGLSPTPHARNKSPKYPDEACRLGQEGTVLLRVAVSEDGTVQAVSVATSCGYALLDQAAVEAVRDWVFEPARFDGKPQRCEIQLPIRFVLKAQGL